MNTPSPLLTVAALLLIVAGAAIAQPPPTVKQAPPPGVAISEADRAELTEGVKMLDNEIRKYQVSLELGHGWKGEEEARQKGFDLLHDIEVLKKAVDWALRYDEFMNPKQADFAKRVLQEASYRLKALWGTRTSWLDASGAVVRGYVSKIDGSVQPYGLYLPDDYRPGDAQPRPLLIWLPGRNDKRTELSFLEERWKGKSDFMPPHAIVAFPYGRYCNAAKFAGETDCFEVIDAVRAHYSIDPQRIAVAGFSMGGASTWHLATQHAGLWCAMSPGAGFAETEIYAKVFDPKKEPPPWWEQVLYRLYDATDYAANLANDPLCAYSGEIDPQKQSADLMEAAAEKEGVKIERIIGPNTAHKYEPGAKVQLAKWLDEHIARGTRAIPPKVHLTTYTLRYNEMKWITLDALDKHWERADIDAELADGGAFRVQTKNIAGFTIHFPIGTAPLDKTRPPRVLIDDQELVGPPVTDGWTAHFTKISGNWKNAAAAPESAAPGATAQLAKRHGVTGPIDDAFVDSFVFVQPTGVALNDKVGEWSKSELDRAVVEWRRVFRGDARVKTDKTITAEDIQNSNLVLWGDPGSNAMIAKLLPHLPLQWTKDQLKIGKLSVPAADHAPILIYPNPLNPARYIVLNSSFTFREGSTTTNALQTPKLPDWAVIDLRTPPSLKWPGLVVDAGFFDERWQLGR